MNKNVDSGAVAKGFVIAAVMLGVAQMASAQCPTELPVTSCLDLAVTKSDGTATAVPGTNTVYSIVASNIGPSNAELTVTSTYGGIPNNTPVNGAVVDGVLYTSAGTVEFDAIAATQNLSTPVVFAANGANTLTLTFAHDVSRIEYDFVTAPGAPSTPDVASIELFDGVGASIGSFLASGSTPVGFAFPEGHMVATGAGVRSALITFNGVAQWAFDNLAITLTPTANVTDTFPAACTSVTWTCIGAGGGGCPAANGSGNLNETVTLPVGGSVTFLATCAISPAATGTLPNTATVVVGPGLVDSNPANDTATDTDTLVPTADVAVTKSDGTATAVPGTNTVYTIGASNAGPSNAPAAQVTDTFPAACTSVTWTCAGAGGGSCPANGSGNLNASVNLPAGGSVTFLATCAISPAATGSLANTANVAPGVGVTDPNSANNSATDTDTLTPTADVTVAKSVDPTAVDVGDTLTYTIVVGNAGPSDAPGVTVTDLFPVECQADLAWTCTPAGGATCTPAGVGDIVDVVNLPVGSSATYVATCTAYSGTDADVVNTASAAVPAGVLDPDPANSSGSATVAINAFAIQEIPTLGRTGLVALLLLLGFAGFVLLRRTH